MSELVINNDLLFESEEGEKKINLKEFSLERNKIIRCLLNQGNTFIGITINYPKLWKESKEWALKRTKSELEWFIRNTSIKIDLLDFLSASILFHEGNKEDESEGYPYISILLCFRNLVKFESKYIDKLLEEFDTCFLKIDYIETYGQIIKFWDYMTAKIILKKDLSDFYIFIFRKVDIYRDMWNYLDRAGVWHKTKNIINENHKDKNIVGLNFNKVKSGEIVLINLLKIFMTEQLIFINEGLVYQKDLENKYTYKRVGSLNNFLQTTSEILNFLTERFPFQLDKEDVQYLIVDYLEKAKIKIELSPSLLPEKKILDFVWEFKNGLYFVDLDLFINFNDRRFKEFFKKFEFKFGCLRFFNFNYKALNFPKVWLTELNAKLNYKDEELVLFCLAFGKLFHNNFNLFNIVKGSVTKSSSKKLNYTEKIRDEHVFEDLLDQALKLFKSNLKNDEGAVQFKKENILTEGLLENKVEETLAAVKIEKTKSSFIFLKSLRDNNSFLENNEVLLRLATILFQNTSNKLEEKLKRELPKILVYCNRLFVKKYLKKEYVSLKNSNFNDSKIEQLIQVFDK